MVLSPHQHWKEHSTCWEKKKNPMCASYSCLKAGLPSHHLCYLSASSILCSEQCSYVHRMGPLVYLQTFQRLSGGSRGRRVVCTCSLISHSELLKVSPLAEKVGTGFTDCTCSFPASPWDLFLGFP